MTDLHAQLVDSYEGIVPPNRVVAARITPDSSTTHYDARWLRADSAEQLQALTSKLGAPAD